MKVGIELKIDVTKIDKQRLYRGEKGTYLTMTAFVDLNEKAIQRIGFLFNGKSGRIFEVISTI